MAHAFPPELSGLLDASDLAASEAAWAVFVKVHSRLLLHVARRVGLDYDAAMDAYTYLLEQLRADDCHRLRAYAADGRSKFTTWLVVVARRLCLDHHRQRYGRARDASAETQAARAERRRLVDLVASDVDLSQLADASTGGRHPAAALQASELRRTLETALGGLGARDRLLLKLRFDDDLSAREIAGLMGYQTPFHVYRRLSVLFGTLRVALRRGGVAGAEDAVS
jgi:RNA polymerase sigma factor (sigma-70 family)